MVIYSAKDIRDWDAFTIAREPIASIDLMERAAVALCNWFTSRFESDIPVFIFCGVGNNGGDGLALARMLHSENYEVSVCILQSGTASADFAKNLQRLQSLSVKFFSVTDDAPMPALPSNAMVVDAIFGTGISRPPSGMHATLIDYINSLPNLKMSIDLPSGLYADSVTEHPHVVATNFTCTFQCPKLAMLMPENENSVGKWEVLDIGLHKEFLLERKPTYYLVDYVLDYVQLKQYPIHAHKGMRGHTLLGVGSANMLGAAVLAAKAALRSGTGLVTVATDSAGWPVLQTAAPEAMCAARGALTNDSFQMQRRIKAIGVGSGWLPDEEHVQQLAYLLAQSELPLLIDATALTLIAQMPHVLSTIANPQRIILTPHVGEFDRLFGYSENHFERLIKAREAAVKYQLTIVLKGAYSRVVSPGGNVFFNHAGNNGMAKGGSGDVLTGLIAGLLAQGYSTTDAAILGNWLHGTAGNFAAYNETPEGMTAGSLINYLPAAWGKLYNYPTPCGSRLASSLPIS